MRGGTDTPARAERLWLARMRWRLRGASAGPLFGVLCVAEAVLLSRLPFTGERGLDLLGSLLLAAALNLALVAVVAPVAVTARRLRRGSRSRHLVPTHVARDRAASALMVGVGALLLVGGLVHHASVVAARDDRARGLLAARMWVHDQAPQYLAVLGTEDVHKQGDHFYRTCLPRPQRDRSMCLWVDTSQDVPVVRPDPDQVPNAMRFTR